MEKIKKKIDFDKDIELITDLFVNSKSYNLVSRYWHYLNIKNFNSIIHDKGIHKYSLSIAKNYYTTIKPSNLEIKKAIDNLDKSEINLTTNIFKKHESFSYIESLNYNLILILLFENLKKTKYFNHLKELGNNGFLGFSDPFLDIENIKVTHDKLNSIFDYMYINKSINTNDCKLILEIGAGSGRTSEVILTYNNKCKYVICDIPPAVYISYKRLKTSFPNKKINFLFKHNNPEDIEKGIIDNDISFIFPHQLSLIKKIKFDISIAIDCLHEMDKKIIKYYFDNINKISNNFYYSVKNETLVPFSYFFRSREGNFLKIDDNSYPTNPSWQLLNKELMLFPGNYQSFTFKIK